MNVPSFSGYEILEVLPKGGMSTVYKARQLSLDRIVAIKTLPPTIGADSSDVEKFMTEARVTASLKHQNIVQVYDFGQSKDGIYYFVMEYISGYSVAAWIRRKQFLSEDNSLLCSLSVAAAMNYAWQKAGIVHRDIKPDNVIIDGDGTVKVADLGLAHSVKSIMGQTKSDIGLVFGTPNYISPEQSRGDESLDCRADIYSLGAMLYHCLTGTMPFEGLPPLEVMDRQITDSIPDPEDVNPRISVWSACLIEKMMAKDRNDRQKDWDEAIRDISNARSEKMPQTSLAAGVASTIKRSVTRDIRLQGVYQPPVKAQDNAGPWPFMTFFSAKQLMNLLSRKVRMVLFGAALILAVVWTGFYSLRDHETAPIPGSQQTDDIRKPQPPLAAQQKSATAAAGSQIENEKKARERFEQVVRWAKANSTNTHEAIVRYRKLAGELSGTKYADLARSEAEKLEHAHISGLMVQLDNKAKVLAAQNRYLEAAYVYEKFHGSFENETAVERRQKAQAFHAKYADYLREQQRIKRLAALQLTHVADEIALIIVEENASIALERMNDLALDLPLAAASPEFKSLRATLEKSVGVDQVIINSFSLQKDQEVNVAFLQGPQKMVIRDVQGDVIIAEKVMLMEKGTIGLQKVFRLQDLTLAEKISRLGPGDGPESALMQTMLAIQHGEYQQAAMAAASTGPVISNALVNVISQRSKVTTEWRAGQVMAGILRRAGIHYDDAMPDPEACLNALQSRQYVFKGGVGLNRAVGQFRARYGTTETARRYDCVLDALTNAGVNSHEHVAQTTTPVTQEEQTKTAQQTIELITTNLLTQNTGLRREQIVFEADETGRIDKVEIISMDIRDIKALENLPNINRLVCAGMSQYEWSEQQVIAPLSDLAPLKKLFLRELAVNNTRVKDISVLSQMPLIHLNLARTKVNDLQPLKDTRLYYLDLSFTPVRDIRPLAGLPLTHLNISGTEISDLSPLADAPLFWFSAEFTRIKDLNALSAMRLKYISLRNTGVSDLAPLRGMPLDYLDLSGTRVRDISALAGMRLNRLDISRTGINDLSALKGMRLRDLDLHDTRVKDLSMLEGMPLENLNISESDVKSISPLRYLPLKTLLLYNTNISDLTPIEDSNIEEIWLDDLLLQANNERARLVLSALHKMPMLRRINGRPVRTWGARDR